MVMNAISHDLELCLGMTWKRKYFFNFIVSISSPCERINCLILGWNSFGGKYVGVHSYGYQMVTATKQKQFAGRTLLLKCEIDRNNPKKLSRVTLSSVNS